ncbi:MAG: hypothetical protein OXL97_14425 [Chloroflexota bacterium]|nr:hypothetical protein [Chloroflexota bacterium]MDE2884826.1 hypothetical protein [Chloroflexota bacterium]
MDDAVTTVEQEEGATAGNDQRLMELLRERADKLGRKGVARLLDVDHRTVGACLETGGLSRRVERALERLLEEERVEGVALRVGDLEGTVKDLRDAVEGLPEMMQAVQELREIVEALPGTLRAERAQVLSALETRLGRRLARIEAHRGRGAAEHEDDDAQAGDFEPRRYPDLVAWEPAPDDEEVYDSAWPLVDEWRRLWADHEPDGNGLPWLATEERIRELELAMLEEHGLTLPPETEPLRGMWRDGQTGWRRKALDRVRRERRKGERVRLVRRVLTIGVWWE